MTFTEPFAIGVMAIRAVVSPAGMVTDAGATVALAGSEIEIASVWSRKSAFDSRITISCGLLSGGIAIGVGSNFTVGGTGISTRSVAEVDEVRYCPAASGSGMRTCTGSEAALVWLGRVARSSVPLAWVVAIAAAFTSTSGG